MEVKDFCSAMESEMTSWKAKMYDSMRKIDKLGTAQKEKVLMNIQDLNMLLDDMAQRVEQLRTECSSDWSPNKTALEQGSLICEVSMKRRWKPLAKLLQFPLPVKFSSVIASRWMYPSNTLLTGKGVNS
jgi:hypothetical protein